MVLPVTPHERATATVADVPPRLGDGEAVEAARALAAAARPGAARRDRDRLHPTDLLATAQRSGLLALTVPAHLGGADVRIETLAEVVRTLAVADPSLAQLTLPNFVMARFIRDTGTPRQQERFFGELLAGARFGNATAEKGTPDQAVRLTAVVDGVARLSGRKYYATGALRASRIGVAALDETGASVVALIEADSPGVDILPDWNSFGQRGTQSGTVVLDNVVVPASDVLATAPMFAPESIFQPFDQITHAAVDVGVARAALDDTLAFVRTRTRPARRNGVERVQDDPHLTYLLGRVDIQVSAAEELLRRGARAVDAIHYQAWTADTIAAATYEVNKAKVFAAEALTEATGRLFELAGTSATDESFALDRHWRNGRTHSVHDPARWRQSAVGQWALAHTPVPDRAILADDE